jgi:hypothetical protein
VMLDSLCCESVKYHGLFSSTWNDIYLFIFEA